jgi:hypothetical protein
MVGTTSKVPEYRIREVVWAAQEQYDRVWLSEGGVTIMKLGPNHSYNLRVDRAVKAAVARGLLKLEEGIRRYRPTPEGEEYLAEQVSRG